jgi:hypothetical protein
MDLAGSRTPGFAIQNRRHPGWHRRSLPCGHRRRIAGNRQRTAGSPTRRQLHDLRRGITQQMDEARNELAFSRFNQGAYQAFVDQTDQVRRRLAAMAEDSSLYVNAQLQPGLVPSLPALVERTAQTFVVLAQAVRKPAEPSTPTELDSTIRALDADLAELREQRATTPFALDRMLPFWALVFNLREVGQDLKQLESMLPQLA